MRRSAEWAVRCMHESRYYERNSFLTLTYDNAHLPQKGTLVIKHLQDFWKRLRMHLQRDHGVTDTKYFACGEYGEVKGRPHYHAVLFGWDFPDKVATENNPWAKDPLFHSDSLTKLWGHGKTVVGTLTASSAAYTARYTMKKVYGEKSAEAYHAEGKIPPFNAVSKGIGRRYFAEFRGDFFPCDYLVREDNYQRIPVPRFYDKLLAEISEEELAEVKRQRKLRALDLNPNDQTRERLKIREAVLLLKIQRLRRNLEAASQNETK